MLIIKAQRCRELQPKARYTPTKDWERWESFVVYQLFLLRECDFLHPIPIKGLSLRCKIERKSPSSDIYVTKHLQT